MEVQILEQIGGARDRVRRPEVQALLGERQAVHPLVMVPPQELGEFAVRRNVGELSPGDVVSTWLELPEG
jgi:hypothetical protein